MLKDKQVKADINNVDEEHQAALHYAARYNHYEIVKLLVENGAGRFFAGHNMNQCRALVPKFDQCSLTNAPNKVSISNLCISFSEIGHLCFTV